VVAGARARTGLEGVGFPVFAVGAKYVYARIRKEPLHGCACRCLQERHQAAADCCFFGFGPVKLPCKPKIFPLPPITSNLSTHT
jgi:hypothetical protein